MDNFFVKKIVHIFKVTFLEKINIYQDILIG